MSTLIFGGSFELLPADEAFTKLFGGTFSLLPELEPFTKTFGGSFSLLSELVPFTKTFGGVFALLNDSSETSITIRKHPVSGDLVDMPLYLMVNNELIDPVTGETF